jgi:glycosyltransferase involved in cell wall biosynthesis
MNKSWTERICPLQLAWLLRADLRDGLPASAPISPSFRTWWAISGRADYPAWASADTSELDELLRPLPDWPRYAAFGVSRALLHLLEWRSDLKALFDLRTEEGIWHALAWFYTHGLREYHLAEAISSELSDALDATPPFFATAGTAEPALNWLMFFVWRCSAELQAAFDLRLESARSAYLSWFLCDGIAAVGLGPLVAERWKQWMKHPVQVLPDVRLPRAGLMFWQRREMLRRTFPPTQDGLSGLGQWTTRALRDEPSLAWMRQPAPSFPSDRALPPRPWGVNLIGFAKGELGIGEDVRMAAAACESAAIPFSVVNIDPGSSHRQADEALAAHLDRADGATAPYAVNIFCLTGFDTARVALERGPALFEGRINIGWWPWELPVWPQAWQPALALVDEIWAATAFTREVYSRARSRTATAQQVVQMPLAVDVSRCKPVGRAALGLPSDRFLYLYVFDFNSYLERKNPFAALRAFKRAFAPSNRSVGLVLKTMNANPADAAWQRFVHECRADPRIILVDRTLDRGEVLGLIQQCDAYVSLHRSEGFGRTLAEAMLFGKPVVATDFSGSVDFLTATTGLPVKWKRRTVGNGEYPFVEPHDQAWWAEPDPASAAKRMREAFAWGRRDSESAQRLKRFAGQHFAPSRIGQLLRERLAVLASRAP